MNNRFPCKNCLPAFDEDDAMRVAEALGPMPRETLLAMMDYGLSDVEISRYFKLRTATVILLKQHFAIRNDLSSMTLISFRHHDSTQLTWAPPPPAV